MMWVHFFPSHKNLLVLVSGGKVVLLSDLLVIIKTMFFSPFFHIQMMSLVILESETQSIAVFF